MEQTAIELPDSLGTTKIYQLVNGEEYLTNIRKSNEGNKAAKRRLRKQLLQIINFGKEGRKELQKDTWIEALKRCGAEEHFTIIVCFDADCRCDRTKKEQAVTCS